MSRYLAIWLSALFLAGAAHAEQLALIHTPSATCIAGAARSACTAGAKFDVPVAADLVALCPNAANCWEEATPRVARFGDLAAAVIIDGCNAPGVARGTALPNPYVAANDPCASGWHPVAAGTFVVDASAFTATPASGQAPLAVTLAWDVKDVTSCTASGAWSGAKAIKGSEAIAALNAAATYTLTCTRPAALTGSAAMSWTAPTANTDNTPLTDLAGFRLVYGNSAGALNQTVQIPGANVSAYTLTGLPLAMTYFAIKAYTTPGSESALSGTVSKVIAPDDAGKTWTRSASVAVSSAPSVPNPPTGLLLTTARTAYRIDMNVAENQPKLYVVGLIDIGKACDKRYPALTFYRVDVADVQLSPGVSRSIVKNAFAKCT